MTTPIQFDQLSNSAFIRERDLVRHAKHPDRPVLLQFSASTLWRYVKAKTFPQPVKISSGITAWNVGDVRAWVDKHHAAALALAAR